jgi:hypothetical protein
VLSAQVHARGRKKLVRHTLEGMGVGLLTSVVTVVVPGFAAVAAWVTSSEVGFFAVSSLASFAGTRLIELAVKRVFPTLAEPTKPAATPT